jgi:hypothetical protein
MDDRHGQITPSSPTVGDRADALPVIVVGSPEIPLVRCPPRGRGRDLGRVDRSTPMAVVATVLVLAASWCLLALIPSDPAGADSAGAGSGGGSVSVGVSSGGGSGGSSGSSGSPGGGTGAAGSPWTCTYTYLLLNTQRGFPNGGPTPGAWYSVTCVDVAAGIQVTQTVWIVASQPVVAPPVDPRALALQAENSMTLPSPVLHLDPSISTVVGLATWLWIDPAVWHAYEVTATTGTVSATAVARPVAVRWNTGDGNQVTCAGPGTAYRIDLPSAWQSTICSHGYLHTSAGQPSLDGNPDNGTFVVTASIDWSVSWSSTGVVAGGTLPTLVTTSATLLRVAQVESVNTLSALWTGGQSASAGPRS